MAKIYNRIAVYCGSSSAVDPRYLVAAREVGKLLAERGIGVVYGGGRVGLMGACADGALAAGGEVIGVITDKLVGLEVGHQGLTRLEVVRTMHQRKMLMAELSDAFIALPGGLGTFEELFEAATWTQLNDHIKPVGLLNINAYYDGLVTFLKHAQAEHFIRPAHASIISCDDTLDGLLAKMHAAELPILGTWKT